MLKLQLLAYFLLIFRGRPCVKKDGQEHFMFMEGLSSSCLCVTLLISLGFPFAAGEQTNPKLLSVSHCVRDEFQSIPLLHRTVKFSEVYFHIQLLVIQCLESRQAILVYFTLSHGGWPQERDDGCYEIHFYRIYLQLLTIGWTLFCMKTTEIR